MLKMINASYVKSIMDWRDAPQPALPEIAFVGRSNVGKSSLINALVNIRNFARVSKQPGKTQSINFFSVDDRFYLVDLPGYGFAKTSRGLQITWQRAIEGYLLNSRNLRKLMILIDARVGVKSSDLQLIEWVKFNRIPAALVATKIDKVGRGKRRQQLSAIATATGAQGNLELHMFSAKDKSGKPEILKLMFEALAAENPPEVPR